MSINTSKIICSYYIICFFNIGFFIGFLILLGGLLLYKYKGKLTDAEKEELLRLEKELQ